jgi:hypothetical protein
MYGLKAGCWLWEPKELWGMKLQYGGIWVISHTVNGTNQISLPLGGGF